MDNEITQVARKGVETVLNEATGQAREWVTEKAGLAKEKLKDVVQTVNQHMSVPRWIALGAVVGMGIAIGCLLRRR